MTADRRLFLELLGGGGLWSAAADQALDVQILQTAASVENVLVNAYDTLLALPLFTGPNANTVVKDLLSTARGQHADHGSACNDIATRLGGRAQTSPNATLNGSAVRARSVSDLTTAVDLALQLETASTHTYTLDLGLLSDLNARRLAGQIQGIEAQHGAVLRVVRAILGAGMPDVVSHDSGTRDRLPPDAAKAGFPEKMASVEEARPAAEGALR